MLKCVPDRFTKAMTTDGETVLVVDDEPGIAEMYAHMLQSQYDVLTANNGRQALDIIDDSVDIVLLDRRMPGMTGDEVLEEIRTRDLDCRVAMLTAVEPDFDILKMGFDDYLVKPVSKDQLRDAVESLLSRSDYESQVQEYFSLANKKALLEQKKTQDELQENEDYHQLKERLNRLQQEVDTTLDKVTQTTDYKKAFQDIA